MTGTLPAAEEFEFFDHTNFVPAPISPVQVPTAAGHGAPAQPRAAPGVPAQPRVAPDVLA